MLAACTVGPNFTAPEAPPAATEYPRYTATPPAAQTDSAPVLAGESQHFLAGQDLPAEWWSLFRSDSLDRLIRATLARNPNLASAEASLRQAGENYRVEAGALLYPNVSGGFNATRERTNFGGIAPGNTFNLYNATVNVSYSLDLFGLNRRTLEVLAATVDYQQYQVEATYLTLVSNTVTTAIREASLRAQLKATNDILALQEKQVSVVNAQFTAGAISKALVLQQQTQAAQTRATLPALEKSLAQARHQLSAFAGQLPSEPGVPEFDLASLTLPEALPLSLPSELVRRRPDIRASEALLHQASAQVGVATANLYPQITLSGAVGASSLDITKLFNSNSGVWNIAGGLTQPLFYGGELRARKRSAEAAYDAALGQYQNTVLVAFQNVADALRAIETDATALQYQAEASALARRTLDLSTLQYRLGAISFLSLLDAQRVDQQTRIALVQAQAARYADTAALLQALGGGWWARSTESASGTQAQPIGATTHPVN